ncbi:hypothetical protein LPJ61_000050 [Coemansia biformis]|uniref:Uncharacterized protein n=1 Tax=Coemansia biformis TaxID=1286918 RepID=A0A9W7YCD2_9FUNG|nr:hypothetical protein LPJ61_000050 [Coemansia biformis]
MSDIVSDVAHRAKETLGIAVPAKPNTRRTATGTRTRRKSSRVVSGPQAAPEGLGAQADVARGFIERLDAISRKLSQLGIHENADTSSVHSASATVVDVPASAEALRNAAEVPVLRRFNIVKPQEKDMCLEMFAPLQAVPGREDLGRVLLETPKVKIPIHFSVYEWLQGQVEEHVLDEVFSIVEEVGNVCPRLTPRVETALQVQVTGGVTESMQQSVLDTFLASILGTATEHMGLDTKIDRNANETSMTSARHRPGYILMINGLLVFKGEEKASGKVRTSAKQLVDKMLPGSVGKNGKLDYLLGYATAGSRILFECIYGDDEMSECSDILNLERVSDRVTLLVILINAMRVARTLYDDKHKQKPAA